VQTSAAIETVDDFGRVTTLRQNNDLTRTDDDLCTQTVYATPTGTNERVLNAPASRATTNCNSTPVTLAQENWEYDTSAAGVKLPAGKVSTGFITAHIISRLNTDTGAPIADAQGKSDIRAFDATYDTSGNPVSVTKTRDDSATQTVTTVYDPFGLAPISVKTEATNADRTALPPITATVTRDPITLATLNTTDPNGAQSGNTFDGFGRVLLSTVSLPDGTSGALSSISYLGFASGDTSGRRIVQKVFTDPVAPANVATAVGRAGTTFLDSLGRQSRIETALGTDYPNQTLIVGQRTYDLLGRVLFEADPHPASESFGTAYGTTQHFNIDGTPSCSIRGKGIQPPTNLNFPNIWPYVTDEANEVYPTCFRHGFELNTEFTETRDAASLLTGSPQFGQQNEATRSAIGRVLTRRSFTGSSHIHEYMAFDYDALGQLTGMKRYQDPFFIIDPVITSWHYDSLGQVVELDDADSAPQFRSYNTWGELTSTQWCDTTVSSCSAPTTFNRGTIHRYDALGRVVHSEDRTNSAAIPETVNDFAYDQPVNNATPPVTATNVIGRLAQATSPTSSVSFSYDPFGRINAQAFTDRTAHSKNVYVEKFTTHGDGSPQTLDLLLPDTNYADENVSYAYDSAGRTRSVMYSSGAVSQSLFSASSSTGAYDVFGRIRNAQYGLATYTAAYADTGRRLLTDLKVSSPSPLSASREISFQPVAGTVGSVTAFDPVGRERVRQELTNGTASPVKVSNYDEIGRFTTSSLFNPSNSTLTTQRSFTYDPLGNLLTQDDPTAPTKPGAVALSYQSTDRDRICGVGYGLATAPVTSCNVAYDGVSNIVSLPSRSGSTRTLSYFPSGQVKTIADGNTSATFSYDAFGAVQQLALTSATSPDTRHDKHFGVLIAQRDEDGTPVTTRTIPAPGLTATRHGPTGSWTFAFGERRGNRFVTNQNGAFVQDIDYQPYGEVKDPTGVLPGTTNYTSGQWNGGDALSALGLVQLRARVYDPVIGRFLSRDPLIIPRSAATTNPYAFANNDPVNGSDPTGLDPDSPEQGDTPECTPPNCYNVPDGVVRNNIAGGYWVQPDETIEVVDSKPLPEGAAGIIVASVGTVAGVIGGIVAAFTGGAEVGAAGAGVAGAGAAGAGAAGAGVAGPGGGGLPGLHRGGSGSAGADPWAATTVDPWPSNPNTLLRPGAFGPGDDFYGSYNYYDADHNLRGGIAELNKDGVLSIDAIRSGPNTPGAKAIYDEILTAYGSNVKSINEIWLPREGINSTLVSQNWTIYREARLLGASQADAIRATFSGSQHFKYGFNAFRVIGENLNKGVEINFYKLTGT